jgi:hypothetical protein
MGIERALHPGAEMRAAADRERDYYFYQLDGQASRRLKERIEALYAEGRYGAVRQKNEEGTR